MAGGTREAALTLASELLDDIEIGRATAQQIVRKASRLARLLNDAEAMEWLSFEIGGYPRPLTPAGTRAAQRSNRQAAPQPDGQYTYWTGLLGEMDAGRDACSARLSASPPSLSGDNMYPTLNAWLHNQGALATEVGRCSAVIEGVIGAVHSYAGGVYHTLRFGSAAETAFEAVRSEVEANIARLVPGVPRMLAAALESAASDLDGRVAHQLGGEFRPKCPQ